MVENVAKPTWMCLHWTLLLLDKLHANVYNVCMNTKDYITLRVRKDTHKKLRVVSAFSEESMLDTLDRLVTQEYDRLHGQRKGTQHDATQQKDQA
ncbi:hypothetical protein [Ktedonobacter robiniae]|uniref:Uncharacterized protein n=1 Tax=Ktedonobacter robiniae TaxID=2778365 RepID=A0ABQ3UGX1_9CHLR|nr:hypothetical protein [Ktedonobacter robiniae]GHO51956.1 hypothetical protein KSB_04310 [Ktedonobacter robiniae]